MHVAPLVGAWIEIATESGEALEYMVAPLVGAWIEIREELKLAQNWNVAPLVGAWIEILRITDVYSLTKSFERS